MPRDLLGEYTEQPKLTQRGHAARPGTGPEGETCRTCQHYCRVEWHNKYWLKCGLMEHAWTHGPGTDIKAGSPACKFWERRIKGVATQV